jgi:replicative DNA helicase
MQFLPSYNNTANITVKGDLNDVSKVDSELSKSSLLEWKIKKTTLKTLAKRVVNRTDPFYFIDIIVIGNYDLWLEN